MKLRKTIIHVVAPLIIGTMIYLLFRSTTLRVFSWIDKAGMTNIIEKLRSFVHPLSKCLPDWIKYSLPDSLWVYSLTSALLIIWSDDKKMAIYSLLIPITLGCVYEIGQITKWIPGTFDFRDLTLNSISLIISLIILKTSYYEKNEQKAISNI